jgi:hypothetical protein
VIDEQRSSRPIFNATPRAAASWLFFCVARSTVMIHITALYRQSGSDRLEKQPTDLRRNPRDLGDGALGRFGAGATLKTALAEVEVDVVFRYVGQTGICICGHNSAAR